METCETSGIVEGGHDVTLTVEVMPTLQMEGGKPGQGNPLIFQQNQRDDEVRIMPVAGALPAEPGMKQQNYLLTSSAAASPARIYRWPVSVRAFRESEAASGLSSSASCPNCGHDGRLSRMSPDFYPLVADATLPSFSTGWANAGSVVSLGRYWTRSTSESRNAADVCTLSQVLQGEVLSKYFLSAKAAAGILRRAERRGKTLPAQLAAALTALAEGPTT